MKKVIIAIHGLENKPARKIIEDWWKIAIKEGLRINGYNHSHLPEFKMAYWADIFYDKPLDPSIEDKNDPYYLAETYQPRPANFVAKEHPLRKKVLDILEEKMDKILLNEDLTVNYSETADFFVGTFFKELEAYYSETAGNDNNTSSKNQIRSRLANLLKAHSKDDILLVSHSMGTIIAYDVLKFVTPEIQINTLVTMGSPLGLPLVMAKTAKEANVRTKSEIFLNTPESITRNWFNLSDLEDKVAINYNLADDYGPNSQGVKPVDSEVNNDYEMNGEPNPHKSYGYLRTPEFSKIVSDFINFQKESAFKTIISYLKSKFQYP